ARELSRHGRRVESRARRADAVAGAENRELGSVALGPHRAQGPRVKLRLGLCDLHLREPRRESRGLLTALAFALLEQVLAVLERELEAFAQVEVEERKRE